MPETTVDPFAALAKMREPFPPNQISKLPKPLKKDAAKGRCQECGGYHGLPAIHLDYVGHAALTDRLLDVDPQWTWEPVAFTAEGLPALDRTGGLWIRLTVAGMTRLGYGSADGKSGGDAVKEIIGDAMRNAAMRFGAALDLWHKGDLHADEDASPPDVRDDRSQAATTEQRATPAQDVPPQGWAKWGDALIASVQVAQDEATLDTIRDTEKRRINLAKAASPDAFAAIGKAFADKRTALADVPC